MTNWPLNRLKQSWKRYGCGTESCGARRTGRKLAQWKGNQPFSLSVGLLSTAAPPRGRRKRMTYDRLVCANCASPVSEGRCPVCRASRERLQQEDGFFGGLTPAALIALLVALIAVAVLAHEMAAAA